MPTQAYRAADIKGLTPAIDQRKAEGLFVLGGKNYAWDAKGPKSIFGNRLLSDYVFALAERYYMQGARIPIGTGDRVFQFYSNGFVEWDETGNEYDIRYGAANAGATPHRWTHGYLNGKMFFCHPGAGIVELDVITGVAVKLDQVNAPGVPANPIAVCIDNGRLVVMDATHLTWSAQSNGRDFVPRLGGAGAQKIADRVGGDPIMLQSYARGVITWTQHGAMQSAFTGDQEVYRHRAINTKYRPINSFCTLEMDDNTLVILDERGLFQSKGESPEPLTPLFNEFLIEYLQKNDLKVGSNVRLEWDELRKLLFVSVSTTFNDPIYEKAFVLYPTIDKWGTFDEPHYGIFPVRISTGDRLDDYFGFMGSDGRIRYWTNVGSRETSLGVLAPLDATIQVGLIRFDLSESYDQLTEVQTLMLGNIVSSEATTPEDYNLIPEGQDEDYQIVEGTEDFGFDEPAYVNHKTRVIGTVDGRTKWDEAIPELVRFDKAARHYSCTVQGIWHILEIKADAVGEAFHLQAFELTASYAGKLL